MHHIYTGGSSTQDVGELKSYIEVDGSIDFNGLTQAVKDFVEANKHKFFFGGIHYCEECQIIHPRDKCPLCEEYNWYVEDSLHDRIDRMRDQVKFQTRYLEKEVSELQAKINDAVMRNRDLERKLVNKESYVFELKSKVEKLKEHKSKLINYIKRLLIMPHRRHIIFDEEEY